MLSYPSPGSGVIFNRQTLEWYWFSYPTPGKKVNRIYFPKCQTIPLRDVYLLFSLWHLARALQRLGSGHRSRGDWPFLLRMVRSAPLAARKHAMDAALFFSAPWVPRPMISYTGRQTRKNRPHKTNQTHIRCLTEYSGIQKQAAKLHQCRKSME